MYKVYPMTSSFWDRRRRLKTQPNRWSNCRCIIVGTDIRSCLYPFQSRQCLCHTAFSRTRLNILESTAVTTVRSIAMICNNPGRDCTNIILQVSSLGKMNRSFIRRQRIPPLTSNAASCLCRFQHNHGRHLSHFALELRLAGATVYASQLVVNLKQPLYNSF
jgi:hypothetical protein